MVIKVILRGFLMFFGFGHWLWSRGLRQAGKHVRVPDDAMPQSACSAGKRSRSATSSTTGGSRGYGGWPVCGAFVVVSRW